MPNQSPSWKTSPCPILLKVRLPAGLTISETADRIRHLLRDAGIEATVRILRKERHL